MLPGLNRVTHMAESKEVSVFEQAQLESLLHVLGKRGYEVIGPTVRDGAIVYDRLNSTADLPIGWGDEQGGGKYRLVKRNDDAVFGYAVGPHSWKRILHPPVQRLWHATRKERGFEIEPEDVEPRKVAFLGVRSCELHAIQIQDKILMGGAYVDPGYKARRNSTFIIAINCSQAGGTCFCISMNTGPKVQAGFDLALTEVLEAGRHYFVAQVGTELGKGILDDVPHREADASEIAAAGKVSEKAAGQMGRSMDTTDIKSLLYRNYEHPRWDDVAARCLTCGNCTAVCPTCFCTTVEDVTDLTGEHAERWQKWDFCFTMDFSHIHGGSVRSSARSRYRQWMTHKLATWIDQFGTSGCVGCGRCITWCPVAIDITEEVRAIRETQPQPEDPASGGGDGDS